MVSRVCHALQILSNLTTAAYIPLFLTKARIPVSPAHLASAAAAATHVVSGSGPHRQPRRATKIMPPNCRLIHPIHSQAQELLGIVAPVFLSVPLCAAKRSEAHLTGRGAEFKRDLLPV